MPKPAAVDAKAQRRVLTWFDEHGRHLPWRETRDPYRTLVAEVMLQQTQTGRVTPAYETFLQRSELSGLMRPNGDHDLERLVEALTNLEREGLAELTPGARNGSPRGIVRLPTGPRKR